MSKANNEKYEDLMQSVGEFGRFQKRLCFFLVLSTVPNGYFAMLMVFVGRTPPFRCITSGYDDALQNSTVAAITTSGIRPNASAEYWNSTHADVQSDFDGLTRIEYDSICRSNLTEYFRGDSEKTSNSNVIVNHSGGCGYGIVYDFEDGRTSIVTEWNLVCERKSIRPLITSIYMGGVLVGSLLSGALSDVYGRYPTFMSGTFFMFIFLALCGVASSSAMFTVFMFFAGVFGFINYVTAFVIATEMINTKDRVITGTLTIGGFAVGYMLLPLFAYYIPNWRHLCLVMASIGVIFIPYFWVVTESPRWLFSKGKIQEFVKLLRKIARVNGLSDEKFEEIVEEIHTLESSSSMNSQMNGGEEQVNKPAAREKYTYLDLFRSSVVRSRTFIMCFTWFTCSVVYYCVGLNTSNMGGNPYINCFVAAAVEIPAYASIILLLKWRGRRTILIASLLLAGIACSTIPFIPKTDDDIRIAIAMIGKFAVSGSFSIVFIFCSELFPTLMRSMGVGAGSMAARVGGMVAPYLLFIGEEFEYLPYLAMGLLSITACLLNVLLPETRNVPLPESINDLVPIKWIHCAPGKGKSRCQKPNAASQNA